MANGTLVDSNVLLDVLTDDAAWGRWSLDALADAAEAGPLFINAVIYAEVSVRFTTVEALDAALPRQDYGRASLPWESAFLAGKAFLAYRRSRGIKASSLSDFFIGAHAAVSDLRLLTRDAARYRTYFPTLSITAPAS